MIPCNVSDDHRKQTLSTAWICVAAIAGVFIAGTTIAGIQVKEKVGRLSVGDFQIETKEGRLGLGKIDLGKWNANAPTITNASGQFISIDPDGKSPAVLLTNDKGPHAEWAFDFTRKIEPKLNGNIFDGDRGYQFRMKVAAEGPYKNWYVGVGSTTVTSKDSTNLPATQTPTSNELKAKADRPSEHEWRHLTLVQDPKSAVIFTYIDTHYWIRGK